MHANHRGNADTDLDALEMGLLHSGPATDEPDPLTAMAQMFERAEAEANHLASIQAVLENRRYARRHAVYADENTFEHNQRDLLRLALLTLEDETTTSEPSHTTYLRITFGLLLCSTTLSTICFVFGNRNDVAPEVQIIANVFGALFTIYSLIFSLKLCSPDDGYRNSIISKRLHAARELIKRYPGFRDAQRLVLFSNDAQGQQFIYKNGSFYIENTKKQAPKDILFPARLPKPLRCLYTPPTADSLGGRVAVFKYLVNGQTDFSGHLAMIDGELLLSFDSNSQYVKYQYDCFITANLNALFSINDPDSKVQTQKRAAALLANLNYFAKRLLENVDARIHNARGLVEQDLKILYSIELGQQIIVKGGVCRHRSVLLARFIQYAIEDGLLQGYVKFRVGTDYSSNTAHAWLEYHNAELFGDAGYFVLDPMNGTCCPKDKLPKIIEDFLAKFFATQFRAPALINNQATIAPRP